MEPVSMEMVFGVVLCRMWWLGGSNAFVSGAESSVCVCGVVCGALSCGEVW